MTTPEMDNNRKVSALTDAQNSTGRQDLIAPDATTEKSDATPVDMMRGKRLWLGFSLVAIVFAAVIVYAAMG
ncbi:hypothetical protein BH09CHL1_BH09CHL1_29700 [soil metagenome]